MIKGILLSLSHAGVDTQQTADQQSRGTDTAGTQQSQQTHRGQQCTGHASRRTEAGGEQWERTWGSAVGCSSGSAQGGRCATATTPPQQTRCISPRPPPCIGSNHLTTIPTPGPLHRISQAMSSRTHSVLRPRVSGIVDSVIRA